MKIKAVNSNKFDVLISKHIELGKCPKCSRVGGQLIVDFHLYGREGVYCKCYECGFETQRNSKHIIIVDNENHRIGTSVIEKSLINAIRNAINDWNGKGKNK